MTSTTPPRSLRLILLALVALAAASVFSVWLASSHYARPVRAADAPAAGAVRPSMSARAFLPGTTAEQVRTSAVQGSIGLNGAGAHIEVADAERLRLSKALTLEAWIRPSSVSSHRHIVGKNYYELSVDPRPGGWVASIELRSRGTWYSVASTPLRLGRWHHVAGTYDGAELRIYVDGALSGRARATGAIDTSTRPLRIGSADGAGDFFHGTIDEVRVSDTPRYSESFTPPAAPFTSDASTIGLWHLDEGGGSNAADVSSGAHRGTLRGNAQWSGDGPWGAAPPLPTATRVPPTATAVPPTATAVAPTSTTRPATATAEPPTATATTVAATATAEPPTATATSVVPTVQPTAVPTPLGQGHGTSGVTQLSTGSLGYSDVGTHQTVRTSDNRVYIFAPEIYKNYVRALRAATTGTPSGFAEIDAARRPQANSSIWSVDAAIDSRDVVHLLYIAEGGDVVYTSFDTAAGRWGTPVVIASSRWPNRNNDLRQGSGSISLALDATGAAHVVYSKTENGVRRVYHNSNAGGAWKEQRVDELPNNDNSHATLAFAPDGTLYVAWLSAPDANRGTLMLRALRNGSWGAQSLVDTNAFANQGYSIDQGPSLAVAPDGTVHVVFVAPYERVLSLPSRYDYGRTLHRRSSDGGRSWVADDPPLRYTHNPSLWIDPQGNLAIFGHREYWLGERCASMLVTVRPAGGSWSAWRVFADGCYDASVSTRWAQFHRTAPELLDLLYWTEKGPNGESDMNQLYYAEVRGGIDTLLGLPPAQ